MMHLHAQMINKICKDCFMPAENENVMLIGEYADNAAPVTIWH